MTAEETARLFHKRKARADFEVFDWIMKREGGAPPIPRDEPMD